MTPSKQCMTGGIIFRYCNANPVRLAMALPLQNYLRHFIHYKPILLKRVGGDREMVDILALVLLHDEQDILTSVELALETDSLSKQIVINILNRLLGGSSIAPIEVPPALALRVEPLANVNRYDNLHAYIIRTQGGQHVH